MEPRRTFVAIATFALVAAGLPLATPTSSVGATASTSTVRLSLNGTAQITGGDSRRPSYSGQAPSPAITPTDAQRQWIAFDTDSPSAVTVDPANAALTGFSADTNARRDVVIRERAAGAPTRIVSIDLLSMQRAADSWDPQVNNNGRFVAFLSNGTFGDGNGEGNERPCDDPSPDESAAGQGNEARDLNGALTDVYVRDRDADFLQNINGSVNVYDQKFLPGQTSGTLPYCGTKTKLVSVGTDELQADKPNGYRGVQDGSLGISDNGRFVVFATTAKLVTTSSSGAVANQDNDTLLDVYVRDREVDGDGRFDERDTSSTYLVSLPTANNTTAGMPSISADGSLIAYEDGSNVRVVRLSVAAGGWPTVTTVGTITNASRPSIGVAGGDGAVAFQRIVDGASTVLTRAITLAPTVALGATDRTIGVGMLPQVDRAGRFVAYSVTESGAAFQSVRAGSAAGGGTRLISRRVADPSNGNGASGALGVFSEVAVLAEPSTNGAAIAFSSDASDLLANNLDSNGRRDVFERGWTGLLSVTTTLGTTQVALPRGVRLTDIPASVLTLDPNLLRTVISAPGGAVRSLPSGGVRSLPAGTVRSLPAGTVRSLPGGGIRSLELQSLPLGGIRSLPSGTLRSLPAGTLRSLDVTLAQLTLVDLAGLTFEDLLLGSPYEGWPLQSVTMRDLLDYVDSLEIRKAANEQLSEVQEFLLSLPIFAIDRDGVFLDGVSLVSLFLGDYTLQQLSAASSAPIDWCSTIAASLAPLCAADSTLLALDLGGADLSKVNLDTINVGALNPRNEVLTWFNSLVPIPQATANTGVATYLTNFLDTIDVPWEQVRLKYPAGIGTGSSVTGTDLEPFARGGLATWTSDVVVAGSAPVAATFTLPPGFVYEVGSAAVQCGTNSCASQVTTSTDRTQVTVAFTAVTGSNRVTVGGRPTRLLVGAPTSGPITSVNGAPVGGAARVAITFDGDPSYDSAGSPDAVPTIAGFDPWASGTRTLDPGTLYYGEIATTSEQDEYQIALPADTQAGSRLTVRLSGMTSDLDLTLFVTDPADPQSLPAGAVRSLPGGGVRSLPGGAVRSLPSGTVRSLPAGTLRSLNGYVRSLPLEDVGSDDPSALPPEILQDIPQSLPGGYVRALSPNRDTTPEIVDTTVGVAAGTDPLRYTVRVTGYNDAIGPYVLRVITDPPVAPSAAQCNAVGDAASLGLSSLATDTTTLVLYPRDNIVAKYGASTVAAIDSKLEEMSAEEADRGRPVQIAQVTTGANFDWTVNDSCSPVRANAVAGSISDEIINLAMPASPTPAPNLQYVVIIGADDVLPMARVQDGTEISNEADYAGSFSGDNPLSRSAASRRVLTDNLYGDLNPGTIGDAALLVPELAVGRLVETPGQIVEQLQRFLDSDGQLDADSKAVAAYDFLLDSGPAIAQNLGANTNTSLISNSWDGNALLQVLGADPDVVSLNAHFDHQGVLTAAGDKGLTLDDGFPDQVGLNDVSALQTSLIFSVGCHSGLNVPGTYFATGGRYRDWADELAPGRADKGTTTPSGDAVAALYVANTGFGYGDTDAIALSEQLMTSFSGLIGTYTAGQALVAAKQDYAGGMGTYVSYDEKVLHESTMYGLPMYQVGPPPAAPSLPDPGASIGTSASVAASVMAGSGDLGLATVPSTGAKPGVQEAAVAIGTGGTNAQGFPISPVLTAPDTDTLRPERQFANGYPIVPKVQVDVTAASPGLTARGAILTGLTSTSNIPANPKYFRSVVDLKTREQADSPDEVYFPTTFQTVNRVGGPGGGEDRLVLLPGQVRKALTGSTTRTDFTSMNATVFYGQGDGDVTPPQIDSVVADQVVPPVVDGQQVPGTRAVVFRVNVSDAETGVWRVVVLYDTDGVWLPIELAPNGIPGEWVGSIQTDLVEGPRFIVQAVNADGRVATATDKGRYYKVTGTRPSLVTIIRGVQGQAGWYTSGPNGPTSPVLAEIVGQSGASFTSTLTRNGTLVGAAGQPYTQPVKLQDAASNRDGTFQVTASSSTGASQTTTVKVDGTPPAVAAFLNGTALSTSSSTPTSINANAVGNLSFSCTDTTSGVASSSVTLPDGTNVGCGATAVLNTGKPKGLRTITVTSTDVAGNVRTTSFYATVVDNGAPTISFDPTAITGVEATGPTGAEVLVDVKVTVTDQFDDGPFTVTCTRPLPGGGTEPVVIGSTMTFPKGTTTVTCTATDSSGNTGSGTFLVTVGDTTAPSLILPGPIGPVQATSSAGAKVDYSASASDAVDGTITPVCSPASGSTFPLGTTTVNCSATDTSGNTGTGSFTVTVEDKVAPELTLSPPNDIVQEASGPEGAVVTFNVTASDAVSGSRAVTCTPPSGSLFALGATSVTCSATDAAGNTGSITFTVTVVDQTAPTVLPPTVAPVEATGSTGAVVNFTVSAEDAVSGALTPTCTPLGSGQTFPVGTTNVTCTATDGSGNTGSATFAVVVRDTTAPSLSAPTGTITTEATGPSGAVVTFTTSATDLVDGTRPVSCTPIASGQTFPVGTTNVTCTASDTRGNTSTRSFAVTVTDTTAPTLTLPGPITVTATSAAGATVTFTATAFDLVDGNRTPTCTPPSGNTFPIGTTTVNCSVSDTRNNSASGSFTVTVQRIAYRYSGFYTPVNMGVLDANGFPSVVNGMNAGRTLPLKFEIFDPNGVELTDPALVDVRILTEAAFRSEFGSRYESLPTASLCAGKSVVPLNSADKSSALKFTGGQYNVGLKTDTRPAVPNCYVAFARVTNDTRPGITALVTLTP